MTFAEIVVVSREYAFEYPEPSRCQSVAEAYIAWCLFKLLEWGTADGVAEVVDTAGLFIEQ